MYTFLQLKRAVEFAAAGPIDAGQTTARVSSGMIVNKAIDHIEKARNWTWLNSITTLPLTSGQAYIALPIDINELLGVHMSTFTQSLCGGIRRVSPQKFMEIQAWTWPAPFIGYMQMGSVAASNTVAATRRIQIAPIPTETTADAVRIIYTRSLHRFPVDDTVSTEDTYVADLPQSFNEVLHDFCLAFAIQVEDEQIGADFTAATNKLAALIKQDERFDAQADNAPQSVMQNMLCRTEPGMPTFFSYTYSPTPP